MKTYTLTFNGCEYASTETTSFAKARAYFEARYAGRYTIIFGDAVRGVMIKKNVFFKDTK